MMHARTVRVSYGILMLIGAWGAPLNAQDKQIIRKITDPMRVKTQAVAEAVPRANQKSSIAVERSENLTTFIVSGIPVTQG